MEKQNSRNEIRKGTMPSIRKTVILGATTLFMASGISVIGIRSANAQENDKDTKITAASKIEWNLTGNQILNSKAGIAPDAATVSDTKSSVTEVSLDFVAQSIPFASIANPTKIGISYSLNALATNTIASGITLQLGLTPVFGNVNGTTTLISYNISYSATTAPNFPGDTPQVLVPTSGQTSQLGLIKIAAAEGQTINMTLNLDVEKIMISMSVTNLGANPSAASGTTNSSTVAIQYQIAGGLVPNASFFGAGYGTNLCLTCATSLPIINLGK
jgi:hypothetical protein